MALRRETVRTPGQIGAITVGFSVAREGEPVTGDLTIQVLDAAGEPLGSFEGGRQYYPNLIEHLTAAQVTAITNFLTAIRTKANAEVLPNS